MLVYLKGRKYLLVSVLTIILDGLIVYLIPSYFNGINYFYPMLTVSLIPFIYYGNKKSYYLIIIISGILYDLFYSSIFLYNVILFIILVNFNIKLAKYFKKSFFFLLVLVLIDIIFYDGISFLLVLLTNYNDVTIADLIYKINHSILLNIMSAFVFWFLFKKDLSHT